MRERPDIGLYEGIVPGCECVIVGTHHLRGQRGWCERIDPRQDYIEVVLRIDFMGESIAVSVDRKFVCPL